MDKKGLKIAAMLLLCIFSLACTLSQYVLLGMAGVQGQVDSLTQVAVPLETDTPTIPVSATPLPEQGTIQQQEETPPVQTSPTDENTEAMPGKWAGTAQWLCDNNAVWWLSMEFLKTGNVRITFSGPSDPIVQNAGWVTNGNNIQIMTNYGNWTGTISGNTITGSFEETTGDYHCDGIWSVTKQ